MGPKVNGGEQISAWYASELPQPKVEERLRGRDWEVIEAKNESGLRGLLRSGGVPDVILLGGSLEGKVGALDVLEWLSQDSLKTGREWLVVPFSIDPLTNEFMLEKAEEEIREGKIRGIKMVNVLGDEPHMGVFDEIRVQALEGQIRAVSGGVEGGVAGDPRRK